MRIPFRVTPSQLGLCICLALMPGVNLRAQQLPVPWPATTQGRRTAEFIEAFNTGDPAVIDRSVAALYRGRQRESAEYWNAVYREVGPLSFIGAVTERIGDRSREVFWFQGEVTRVWIGISLRIEPEEPYRIIGNSVMRGVRAPNAPVGRAVSPAHLVDSLATYLETSARAGHFSGAVAVARDGEVLFQEAYGFADRARQERNTPATRFNLASVTKLFTGVAIAQLVEQGRLSFDDPISRFIPEYPEHIGTQVTVRHLLTHSSGIELDDDRDYNVAVTQARSMTDLLNTQVRYIERLNLDNYDDFTPLGRFDYTNEGIDLLGVIIERASGQTWDAYLREHVFAAARMTDTRAHQLDPIPGLATGYTSRRESGGWIPGERQAVGEGVSVGDYRPAGTGSSTVGDMVRFVTALQSHRLVNRASLDSLITPKIDVPIPPGLNFGRAYGFTFDITTTAGGVRQIGHTGGAPGMGTVVQFYPELGYTVVILSNFDRAAGPVDMFIRELIGAV